MTPATGWRSSSRRVGQASLAYAARAGVGLLLPEDLLALVRINVEKSELVTSKDLKFSVFPARTANIRHFRKSVKNLHLGVLLKNFAKIFLSDT